ncbi:hypothetical protein IFM89_028371, partial [Coptis chinensis]
LTWMLSLCCSAFTENTLYVQFDCCLHRWEIPTWIIEAGRDLKTWTHHARLSCIQDVKSEPRLGCCNRDCCCIGSCVNCVQRLQNFVLFQTTSEFRLQ